MLTLLQSSLAIHCAKWCLPWIKHIFFRYLKPQYVFANFKLWPCHEGPYLWWSLRRLRCLSTFSSASSRFCTEIIDILSIVMKSWFQVRGNSTRFRKVIGYEWATGSECFHNTWDDGNALSNVLHPTSLLTKLKTVDAKTMDINVCKVLKIFS